MDFEPRYTPDAEAFRRELRGWLGGGDGLRAKSDGLWQELAERRWAAPSWPRRYGGGGGSAWHDLVLREELLAAGAPLFETNREVGAAVLTWGDERQRRELLPGLIRTDLIVRRLGGCLLAVQDPGTALLTATRDGDVYLVSGEDAYPAGPCAPTHVWAAAVTDPQAPPRSRLSALLVPAGLPGISIEPEDGSNSGCFRTVLEAVPVPAELRIGGEGDGWLVVQSSMDSQASGDRMLEEHTRGLGMLLQRARELTPSAEPVREPSRAGERLAEAYIEGQVLRLLALRNRWLRAGGRAVSFHEPQYALLAARAGETLAAIEDAVFGPATLMPDEGCVDGREAGAPPGVMPDVETPPGFFEELIAVSLKPPDGPEKDQVERMQARWK